MAEVHELSDIVSGLDASPPTYKGPKRVRGVIHEDVATIQLSNTDSVGSTYRMVRVPSHARITQILMSGDGADTDATADIGVYKSDDAGGAVVDADFFASAWGGLNSAVRNEDITYESATSAEVEEEIQPLWEQLGETEDPGIDYDIALTAGGSAIDADTDVAMKVRYVTTG